jgi:GNAT superfamily N-acetyltransferase
MSMSAREAEAITVRPGGETDIPDVIELMRVSLGEGNVPRTPEFWHWKHRANPFGPSPMWLAHSEGRLVGVRLFLRWGLCAGSGTYTALRAVDTATHPDFQGKGIFKRLTTKLVEAEHAAGTELIFNTPNDKSRPGYLKMGWSAAGRLSLWIRPIRPLRLLRAALSSPKPARDDGESTAGVAVAAFDDPSFGAMLESKPRGGYHTQLSKAYLGWRYTPPGISYGLEVTDGAAAVLYRLRRRGELRELRICDLLMARGFVAGVGALRSCLARAVARHRPDYVVTALRPELLDLGVATALGFLPAPRIGPILTVRSLQLPESAPDPRRLLHWSTSIGDLELF